jgi:hypothetical protein
MGTLRNLLVARRKGSGVVLILVGLAALGTDFWWLSIIAIFVGVLFLVLK